MKEYVKTIKKFNKRDILQKKPFLTYQGLKNIQKQIKKKTV